jgi:hypothetical protein
LDRTSIVTLKFLDVEQTLELAPQLFRPRNIYVGGSVLIDVEAGEVHIQEGKRETFEIVGFESGSTTLTTLKIREGDHVRPLMELLVERGYVSSTMPGTSIPLELQFEIIWDEGAREVRTLFPARGQTITLNHATGEGMEWRMEGQPNEALLGLAIDKALEAGQEVTLSLGGGLPQDFEIRPGLPEEQLPFELRQDRYRKPGERLLMSGHVHPPSPEPPMLSSDDVIILTAKTVAFRDPDVAEVILQQTNPDSFEAVLFQLKPEAMVEFARTHPDDQIFRTLAQMRTPSIPRWVAPFFGEWVHAVLADPERYLVITRKTIRADYADIIEVCINNGHS